MDKRFYRVVAVVAIVAVLCVVSGVALDATSASYDAMQLQAQMEAARADTYWTFGWWMWLMTLAGVMLFG